MSPDETASDPFSVLKRLLIFHGILWVDYKTFPPLDHLQRISAAVDLAKTYPANPLVTASLVSFGLCDMDPDDEHYNCRALLHKSNPAIGVPLSYALTFDNDPEWRKYAIRADLSELCAKGTPVAALCARRLCEIIRSDTDADVVMLATEVLEDALPQLHPLFNTGDDETRDDPRNIERLVKQELNLPMFADSDGISSCDSAGSINERLRQTTVALQGGDVAMRCEACMALLQSGWQVGLYLLAFQYQGLVDPIVTACRERTTDKSPIASKSAVAMVGELLMQSSKGVKEWIDGLANLRQLGLRRGVEYGGSDSVCELELMEHTRQIARQVPEVGKAVRFLY